MAKKNQEAKQAAAAELAPPAPPKAPKIPFDAWWAMNEKKIPGHHMKEIVWADFRGRGLSSSETIQSYNDAMRKYGLKLSN